MEQEINRAQEKIQKLKSEIQRVIVGYDAEIDQIIVALLTGGHVLLEGVPGIGKTLLVKTLAQVLSLNFARIQFTPDLMPADITGTNIIIEDTDGRKKFQFQKGPVFNHIILADEINRATPKTQSALLEVMQEFNVTVSGSRYTLEMPFMIVATQNPIEMEGTYPLPEAQLDRFFFKIEMLPPKLEELNEIISRTTTEKNTVVSAIIAHEDVIKYQSLIRQIPVANDLVEYINKMILATHPNGINAGPLASKYVRYGASPRAAQAIVLGAKALAFIRGRLHVSPDDISELLLPVLRHRIILNIEGEVNNIAITDIVREIKERIPLIDTKTKKILSISR